VCFIREDVRAVGDREGTIAVEGTATHFGIIYFPKTFYSFRKTHKF
jgi:hypothetical protein